MTDLLKDPEFRRWAKDVLKHMTPAMADSSYVITIAPTKGIEDVKIAVEIGFAILMDKPLIVFAPEGRIVAPKLLRIADHVVIGNMDTPAGREVMMEKLRAVMDQ